MKLLIAHNRYKHRGGEDSVFENEVRLLTGAGHQVRTLDVSNDAIRTPWDKTLAMLRTVENPVGMATMTEAIREFQPDLVHVHNYFPLLSPAVFSICHLEKTPVVQTLHNYRPICANGLLLRESEVCHLCLNRSVFWGILYRCYQHSIPGSIATARMISVHKKRNTWNNEIDHHIALSEFSRHIFVEAGFPEDSISVKPNFIDDSISPALEQRREGALYVGRLSKEKGVQVLLEASSRYGFPVRIVGDGPELSALKASAPPGTSFLGELSHPGVIEEMARAAVIVVPSLCYENCPLVILEAYSCATPVVGSRWGALPEMIQDGVTGYVADKGNSIELGEKISRILADPSLGHQLGAQARRVFLEKYTPEHNLSRLEAIYEKAILRFHVEEQKL